MTWEEMEGLERAESRQWFVGRRRPTYKIAPVDFVISRQLPKARLERNDQLTPTKRCPTEIMHQDPQQNLQLKETGCGLCTCDSTVGRSGMMEIGPGNSAMFEYCR